MITDQSLLGHGLQVGELK